MNRRSTPRAGVLPSRARKRVPQHMAPAASRRAPARAPSGPRSYRPEIQGLRAVAILMVVCYHIWFDRVSGGVDIFLLISAFLLTGSFTRKLESGRPLQVPRYWVHTFKRLVPPAALVILATAVFGMILLPATRWLDLMNDAVASVSYWENWLLAAQSVDYYATDHSTVSPLQHFWSLSVQGQVFLLWPALFAIAAVLVARFRWPVRTTLLTMFGILTTASLAWSIHLTATDQAFAYFDTRTRLWEFSLGSMLALALPFLEGRRDHRAPAAPGQARSSLVRACLGWAGLILILACGWVVDVQGAFPGWIALWPLLSACLVIIAGHTGYRWGADTFLGSRALRWLGDQSYALYLVHWPLLVLTLVVLDQQSLDLWQGSVVIAASIGLAWCITTFVDTPVRTSSWLEARWWRGLLVVVVSASLVVGGAYSVRVVLDVRTQSIEAESARNNPGARSLLPGYVDPADADASPLPDLAMLHDDWFEVTGTCRGRFALGDASAELGEFCAQEGNGRGKTLVVVGDSRDQQLAGAITSRARAEGWSVVTVFAGGCAYGEGPGVDPWCEAHNKAVTDYLLSAEPDVVVSSSTWISSELEEEPMPGHDAIAQSLVDHGITVIGQRAIPRLASSPSTCLEDSHADPASYELDVSGTYLADPPVADVDTSGPRSGHYYAVDLSEDICPGRVCVPEIGNVYVWMDPSHITARYGTTLNTALDSQLAEQGYSWS